MSTTAKAAAIYTAVSVICVAYLLIGVPLLGVPSNKEPLWKTLLYQAAMVVLVVSLSQSFKYSQKLIVSRDSLWLAVMLLVVAFAVLAFIVLYFVAATSGP